MYEVLTITCFYSKVNRKPWISCPADIFVNLPPNQATYVLGFKWDLPKSNMKNVHVVPDYLNEQYPFPAGKTRVIWTATNENGDLKMCHYYVTVNGEFLGAMTTIITLNSLNLIVNCLLSMTEVFCQKIKLKETIPDLLDLCPKL